MRLGAFAVTNEVYMSMAASILYFLFFSALVASGTISSSTTSGSAAFTTFVVEPSSASLAGGKASLIVTPLTRRGENYVGDYQIKVVPYFFKNEKGRISIGLPEESLLQITQGKSVRFAGTAKTSGSGKTRPINGLLIPTANDRGSVTFSIKTDNGALIFTSDYKSSDK